MTPVWTMGGGQLVTCVLVVVALMVGVAAATTTTTKGGEGGKGLGRGRPATQPYIVPLRNVLHNRIRLGSRYDHP